MKLKKFIFVFLLLFSAGFVSACGREEAPTLEERLGGQVENLESFEGVIQGISKNVYQQGTHELKTEDEEILYIQSSKIDFNKYIGEKVAVQGEMKKAIGDGKPVLSVSKIEYVKEEVDQADLKLYENKVFGLKFEYPKTWLISESEEGLNFSFEERTITKLTIFSDETNLEGFVNSQEEGQGEEVTIAAQKAFRFISSTKIPVTSFYIPNPAKNKIYKLEFTPDEAEEVKLKDQFYHLLDTLELSYISQKQGQACGGEPPVTCPEDYFCELTDDSEFAEGVCVQIGGATESNDCPLITPPSDCSEYRIKDYSPSGCPTTYVCEDHSEALGSDFVKDRDQGEEGDSNLTSASEVTGSYVNDRLGFSVNYPKDWYYISFGLINDKEEIGFSEKEFDEPEDSMITLKLQNKEGGKASKKVGDLYYVFDGPSDLTGVMEEMAQTVEKIEE